MHTNKKIDPCMYTPSFTLMRTRYTQKCIDTHFANTRDKDIKQALELLIDGILNGNGGDSDAVHLGVAEQEGYEGGEGHLGMLRSMRHALLHRNIHLRQENTHTHKYIYIYP